MKDLNNETPAVGEVLKPTPGPWELKDEGPRVIVIAPDGNQEPWSVSRIYNECGPDYCRAKANSKLIVASCNSYQKHFPADPVTAAESDELGNVLAQNQALRALVGELAEGLENCRSELKYLEDACDSAYARPSDTIVADTAALIAKAKEAGL